MIIATFDLGEETAEDEGEEEGEEQGKQEGQMTEVEPRTAEVDKKEN